MTAGARLFTNGRFLTQDAACPLADAVAVRDGRIVAVGTEAVVRATLPAAIECIDLRGRTVVPGFVDAHAHLWKMGSLRCGMLDLRGVRSLADLVDALRGFAALQGGTRAKADGAPTAGSVTWVVGRGFNEAVMEEHRMPDRHDLDGALPGIPVFLTRTCGHIAVASTTALALAGVDHSTTDPVGGCVRRDAAGEPTGVLEETAMGLVGEHVPPPDAASYARMITTAAQECLSKGITTTCDAGVTPEILDVYRDLEARGELACRVHVMPLRRPLGSTVVYALPDPYTSDTLRVDTVKILADGGLSGATAALREPYAHDSCSCGILRADRDELLALARDAHARGWHVAVHAIGDAAIEHTLDAFEALGPGPWHRIEHFGLPDAAQLARARRLGVAVAPQPVFVAELGANFRRYLPDKLLQRAYAHRSMLDAGLLVAFSSDAPVVPDDNPLLGMQAAVQRRDPSGPLAPQECVDIATALRCYTEAGGRITGFAVGRLAPGLLADMAVLSGNPLETAPPQLTDLRVEATILGGVVVYRAEEP